MATASVSRSTKRRIAPRATRTRSLPALRKVDAAAANEVWSGACDELRADCAAANSHYKKVEDQKVSQVTDKIYNSYLQTVGVESGRQSYGEVVDLLTAWYFTQEATQ